MGGENRKIPIFCWFCWPRLISRELCFMGYPGENRRLSEDTVSTLEMHHAFRQQFRAEPSGSLKHEKATGWLSRRSKGENSLLSSIIAQPTYESRCFPVAVRYRYQRAVCLAEPCHRGGSSWW